MSRDIDGAARDVQAAINAARADLPTSLRANPTYRKVNPADAPIMVLTLTSDTLTRGQLYDAAPRPSCRKSSRRSRESAKWSWAAVRCRPCGSSSSRRRFTNMASVSRTCGPRSPAPTHTARKARIDVGDQRYQIYANDQANTAEQYRSLIIAYRNGAAVRLSDVGEVSDLVENLRNAGLANGKPAVLIVLYRQPGAQHHRASSTV